MKKVTLKYGSEEIPLDLPGHAVRLSHTEPPMTVTPESFTGGIRSYLENLDHRPADAGIMVSDKTRLCQYTRFLPLLCDTLTGYGIARERITFYIAYGTHPKQTEEECLSCYGDTYRQFRFVHHDSRDESRLISLGKTAMGTPVKILEEVTRHELLITFGAISHHYFAGFGGGRKLLVPGLAGYETILQNHRIFLDFENDRLREGCESGNLESNPLARDLEEISAMLPPRLEIHGILNSSKELCEVRFGTGYEDFRKACRRYDSFFRSRKEESGKEGSGEERSGEEGSRKEGPGEEVSPKEGSGVDGSGEDGSGVDGSGVDGSGVDESGEDGLFDMVVASAGGYPKDINFIQSHKSIHNAASFIRDGGTLVIFAECRDGIGNRAFMNLFALGDAEKIYRKMEVKYENNAGTALSMMGKAGRIRIRFVTSFDHETCRMMGAVKTSVKEAWELASSETGPVAWIENASLLYK